MENKYTQAQINDVKARHKLLRIQGNISDENCVKYLDWYLATQSATAMEIDSMSKAKEQGFAQGARKLEEERNMMKFLSE